MKLLKALGKPFVALAGKCDAALKQKIAMSVVRHLVTAAGGILVAKGLLADAAQPEFVSLATDLVGVLLIGAGTASGAAEKAQQ